LRQDSGGDGRGAAALRHDLNDAAAIMSTEDATPLAHTRLVVHRGVADFRGLIRLAERTGSNLGATGGNDCRNECARIVKQCQLRCFDARERVASGVKGGEVCEVGTRRCGKLPPAAI
jgi:hypothetical protein